MLSKLFAGADESIYFLVAVRQAFPQVVDWKLWVWNEAIRFPVKGTEQMPNAFQLP